ncbi:30S ribosomal protein S6e [Candidatus Micrarchaeota archaeon]|nr:MAG: 30S ribosomal protein S6e [Candidatus Micrarchaeota archaeon]
MKMVIGDPKSKRSYQVEVPADKQGSLMGLKIGDTVEGGVVGAAGYKLQITGGSDGDGTPMRSDIKGAHRVNALLSSGAGFGTGKPKGMRKRKLVRGNTVSDEIEQLNVKVVEAGSKPLEELFPSKKKEGEKKE